jgi:DNA mismatch repair protein MutS2
MQGVAPQLTEAPSLHLVQARHPLLSTPIPVDVHLGPEDKTLVITGPNTGGKTAVLKTVGLLALMAQSGLHIAAAMGSRLPLFTEIFVDLGDEQSLQQNLSTFSAHLANIRTMMSQVSSGSLILLDELGAGTDPMEGGPLGAAILEYFHDRGAMTLATTHHSTIKAFAMSTPGIACAAVDFDLETLQPRYRLVYGLPGRSKAFAIAQKLGLPERVILRAQQEAGAVQLRSEQLLSRLEITQQAMDDEQQSLNQKRVEIERAHTEARQRLAHATTEEQRIRQELSAEGQALLKAVRQELDGTLAALRKQLPPESTITFPHEAWRQAVQAITTLAPTPVATTASPLLEVGEWVRVRGRNIRGRLRTPMAGNHTVQVEVGTKTITVASSEVERGDAHDTGLVQTSPPRSTPRARHQQQAASIQLPNELHLLGYTVEEALPAVDKHIDQAFTQGVSSIRIVHGVGSGRLRESIRDFLGNHPLVRRFHASDLGGGITIVELEG